MAKSNNSNKTSSTTFVIDLDLDLSSPNILKLKGTYKQNNYNYSMFNKPGYSIKKSYSRLKRQ